ncbi:uncharacterized protein METZ01_LOCUS507056, partial [marine metagenome]
DCEYAEENYDCDGNCTAGEDCNGDCGGSAEVDECGVCGGDGIADGACDCDGNVDLGCGCGEDCESQLVDILYSSDTDIAGFQFGLEGVVSASGGDAAAAGFTVSTGGGTVLGFSFTGSVIPAGSGVLTVVEVQGDACITDLVLTDANAQGLDGEIDGCYSFSYGAPVATCDDEDACNTGAEGDCTYAEDNYDCDGNCTAGEDCNGDCGGSAEVDECGECGGDGIADGACDC